MHLFRSDEYFFVGYAIIEIRWGVSIKKVQQDYDTKIPKLP